MRTKVSIKLFPMNCKSDCYIPLTPTNRFPEEEKRHAEGQDINETLGKLTFKTSLPIHRPENYNTKTNNLRSFMHFAAPGLDSWNWSVGELVFDLLNKLLRLSCRTFLEFGCVDFLVR